MTHEIAHGNSHLSERTERTAAFLQEASASVEQLGSVAQNSVQEAQAARTLANEASHMAQQCGGVVADVVSTMQDIHIGGNPTMTG